MFQRRISLFSSSETAVLCFREEFISSFVFLPFIFTNQQSAFFFLILSRSFGFSCMNDLWHETGNDFFVCDDVQKNIGKCVPFGCVSYKFSNAFCISSGSLCYFLLRLETKMCRGSCIVVGRFHISFLLPLWPPSFSSYGNWNGY